MFRLAHLSDIHLGPLPPIAYRDLASKRIVGYVNWQRNRRRHLNDDILGALLSDIEAHGTDHTAVTGDLVNLALDREIEMAREWLEMVGTPHDVSLVPGNHDAYVPGAFDKACRAWGAWMSGDRQDGPVNRHSFPYLRVRGEVALIGVSTARATAPFMANGFFREKQASKLAEILRETGRRGLFRLVMIHHPPVREAVAQPKRLFGISLFQRIVRDHGADLVIHGHSHEPSLFWIEGQNSRPVPVVGVSAAGAGEGGRRPAGQWNLIEIDGEPDAWQLRLTRRGFCGHSMPVRSVEKLDLGQLERRAFAAA
jgi:3',5'-cyclic AMP phosphodiesterase CpdA